jgi:hypothetical protein
MEAILACPFAQDSVTPQFSTASRSYCSSLHFTCDAQCEIRLGDE